MWGYVVEHTNLQYIKDTYVLFYGTVYIFAHMEYLFILNQAIYI